MATKTIEKDLLKLEKRYWQALKDNDVNTALNLTDEPCIVAGPQGVSRIDKKQFESMMKESQWQLLEFEIGNDVQIRQLSDDVAVLVYTVHEQMLVDGKPVTLDAAETSTWVRRNGGWACAMHSEAITGDPFGRDSAATS